MKQIIKMLKSFRILWNFMPKQLFLKFNIIGGSSLTPYFSSLHKLFLMVSNEKVSFERP